ncbi:tRNA pseudouridine(13) synthase TruD [Candidatus Woesearchaeota archaeon]|nr:tRNA pseudouridine(13) synthase TruD [Candidatus Woesearchaeota archaeon]
MYLLKKIPEDFIVQEKKQLTFIENGTYSYFLLRKCDYTTEKAVALIAQQLHLPRKRINYAGAKDRYACTEQYISIRGYVPRFQEKSFGANGSITLRYFGRGNERLNLGSHEGNAFVITVRNLDSADIDQLQQQLLVLKDINYHLPNYFDVQRFSSQNIAIGMALLHQNMEQAAKLMNPSVTHPFEELRRNPKRILQLYVHSVQSVIYNRMVTLFLQQKISKYVIVNELLFPTERLSSAIYAAGAPLVGFGTPDELETYDPEMIALIQKIMQEYQVTFRDFIVRKLPEASSEGTSRQLFFDVASLKTGIPVSDELHPGKKKVQISFILPQGSYATIVIKFLCLSRS